MNKILFHNADRTLTIPHKKELKEAIAYVFKHEKVLLDRLDYIFCSDDYILDINQRFLKHDYYTDIITFDLSEGNATKGEIYVSIDRVKENAALTNEDFFNETARVVFHGALHLCGYGDKSKAEQATMRKKEDYYIQKI